mgnify:FL=1
MLEKAVYYFLLFIIYSFAGWLYESILCSVEERRFVNRGFLNSPVCPIYGSGAILVVVTLGNIKNPLEVFLLGVVLTGILEYLTSYIMEKLFNAKWWDYSERKFNINGRVCLLGAFVFGLMTLLAVYILNPFISSILIKIDYKILLPISILLIILLSIDLIVTVCNLINLNDRLAKLQKEINMYIENTKAKSSIIIEESRHVKEHIIEESKIKKEKIKDSFIELFEESEFYSEKFKKILKEKTFQDIRLIKAFPNIKSTKYREAFEKFKDNIKKKQVH